MAKSSAARQPTSQLKIETTVVVSERTVCNRVVTYYILRGPTKSRPDAARVGRDSNACMTVPIPSAATGLSVVTVGWLLELSFKKPSKMRSLME